MATPETQRESSPNLTLEQKRAAFALRDVQDIAKNIELIKAYKPFVNGFPAMVLMDGLGQAVATLMAKPKEKHRVRLLTQLTDWLTKVHEGSPYAKQVEGEGAVEDKARLMYRITKSDQRAYVLAQAEVLALCVWLKKFAGAFAPTDQNEA